jgi:tight adherence protein B
MRTALIGLTGVFVAAGFARAARRFAVSDRLRDVRVSRALPRFVARPVEHALDAAAVDCSVEQALQIWVMAILVAGLLGTAFAGGAGVVFAIGVAVGCPVGLRLARGRRDRQIAAAVSEAIERVASELRAGGTIATGIAALATNDGPLSRDLARAEARVHLGASLDEALRAWSRERRASGVEAAAGALALCTRVGGQSADALDGLASSLRERLGVLAEARALSSQARMSALVIGLAPLAYLAFSTAFDRRTTHLLFATRMGQLWLVVGLALEVLGAWWMRRIVAAGDPS